MSVSGIRPMRSEETATSATMAEDHHSDRTAVRDVDNEKDSDGHQSSNDQGPETGLARSESEVHFKESQITLWRFTFLCVGLCLGLFMSMIDSSIVATSLYTIGTEFDDLERINWVALAYTLAFLGCSVFFARMTDIVGRRNAFLAAFVIFFCFSLGCGFAQNMDTLIACRVLQGIGGSGLFSVTMIIFPEMTPNAFRNAIPSVIGMIVSTAGVLGPVLGGLFTEYSTWRWIFWLNGPLGFVSMCLFYLSWPKAEFRPTMHQRPWKDLDFFGSFLIIAAAVLVTFAFQNAGTNNTDADPWKLSVFIGPLVAGVVSWMALLAWEITFERRWRQKMAALPLVLFRNHVFAATTLNTLLLGFAYLASLYAIPLRLQVVNGKGPIMAGVLMLPMLGATGFGSVISGVVSKRKNHLAETMLAASIMVTLGLALQTTVSDSEKLEPKFLGFMVFIGLGYGMITSSATMFTAIEAPLYEHAPAQGIISQSRMLGGSIGIAMSSAVLAAQQRAQLAGIVPPSVLQNLQNATLTDAQDAALRKTYNDSFTQTMKICAIIAGIGAILTIGTYRRQRKSLDDMRKSQIREEVARRQQEKNELRMTRSNVI